MAYGMGPEGESKLDPMTCDTPLAISSLPQRDPLHERRRKYGLPPKKETPLLFRRPRFLDLKDVLLQLVSLGEKLPSPPPPVPRPPPQFLTERHSGYRGAASGSLLKRIPVVAVALLKEPLIEMIVQPLFRSTFRHWFSFPAHMIHVGSLQYGNLCATGEKSVTRVMRKSGPCQSRLSPTLAHLA
jgi:hypothetical protein